MTTILALNAGHDGSTVILSDGRLLASIEAEKDSLKRHSKLTAGTIVAALELCEAVPDVIALGGWHKHLPGYYTGIGQGYFGLFAPTTRKTSVFGHPVTVVESTHERSHIFCAVGMDPSGPHRDCAVLVWEGALGNLYRWSNWGARIECHPVLAYPGTKYAAFYDLADPLFSSGARPRDTNAGKLMALVSFGDAENAHPEDVKTVHALLTTDVIYPFDKDAFTDSPLYNIGLESIRFRNAAAYLSKAIFGMFLRCATEQFSGEDLPLVVAGGCGLNCDWNSSWVAAGLFSRVFVPPCPNDSGSAIGTAIDAQFTLGGSPHIDWDVYAGSELIDDLATTPPGWTERAFDPALAAARLARQEVIAYMQGRSEIGPRALGHRSLLASPAMHGMRDRLNSIKKREVYRPVAPCVLMSEYDNYFEGGVSDPYMLYISNVRSGAIPAVTHVDGSARVQVVTEEDGSSLSPLLQAFHGASGVPVLCNTSLNWPGRGFINKATEALAYCQEREIESLVVGTRWFVSDNLHLGNAG